MIGQSGNNISYFAKIRKWRTKKQIKKLNPKMGFWSQTRLKRYFDLKTKIGLIFEEVKTVKAKKRKRKRRKRKRKKREESRKVWKVTLSMELYGSMEF